MLQRLIEPCDLRTIHKIICCIEENLEFIQAVTLL